MNPSAPRTTKDFRARTELLVLYGLASYIPLLVRALVYEGKSEQQRRTKIRRRINGYANMTSYENRNLTHSSCDKNRHATPRFE